MNKHKHIEEHLEDFLPYKVVGYNEQSHQYEILAAFKTEEEANHYSVGYSDNQPYRIVRDRPYRIVRESDGAVIATFRFASDMEVLYHHFYSHISRMERYLVVDMEWIDYK